MKSRFVDDNKSSDFNNAYMKLYAKNDPTAPVSPGGSTGVFRVEEKSLPDSPNRNRTNSTEAVGLEF